MFEHPTREQVKIWIQGAENKCLGLVHMLEVQKGQVRRPQNERQKWSKQKKICS